MASESKIPEASPLLDGTKDYKPLRSQNYDAKKPHITETPITAANWYKHVNWLNVTFILLIPLTGLIASYWTPLNPYTALFAVVYYFNTGLGITAGKPPPPTVG